jgi:hypothetical protein
MHALKIIQQDEAAAVIGGYGVVFGGFDLEGETFTPDTDFMLDLVPVKPVYIDHSEGTTIEVDGKAVKLAGISDPVGQIIEVTADDVGLYMQFQVEKANRYWSVVEQMIGTGKAGLSSGTIGHLARRAGKTITRWPIVEESITLTPAEPRTVGIERLKHLTELNPGLEVIIPEADGTPAEDGATDEGAAEVATISILEGEEMSDTQATPTAADEQIKALSDRVNQLVGLIENSPALKSAGYATDDGGAADPTHKSFGDSCWP